MPRAPQSPVDLTPAEPLLDASAIPAEVVREAVGADAMPLATAAQLVAMVEKLFERVDRGEQGSMQLLQQVLEQHGSTLKQTLSPENRLHPDVSDLNPLGERDNPRPKLKRLCYFLGVPLEQPLLTLDEITLLNRFTEPREIPSKGWRVAFLRDAAGGEALYISVPFKGFDDLRGLEGGWQRVCRELLGDAAQSMAQPDHLLRRIAALEELVKAMAAGTPAPPVAP